MVTKCLKSSQCNRMNQNENNCSSGVKGVITSTTKQIWNRNERVVSSHELIRWIQGWKGIQD
jgi:hypothetical protein